MHAGIKKRINIHIEISPPHATALRNSPEGIKFLAILHNSYYDSTTEYHKRNGANPVLLIPACTYVPEHHGY